jgi:cobalamin synthase
MRGKHSRTGTILAAAVLIGAGFTVAAVEILRLPKGTIWIVVAVAVAALTIIRAATRRKLGGGD